MIDRSFRPRNKFGMTFARAFETASFKIKRPFCFCGKACVLNILNTHSFPRSARHHAALHHLFIACFLHFGCKYKYNFQLTKLIYGFSRLIVKKKFGLICPELILSKPNEIGLECHPINSARSE